MKEDPQKNPLCEDDWKMVWWSRWDNNPEEDKGVSSITTFLKTREEAQRQRISVPYGISFNSLRHLMVIICYWDQTGFRCFVWPFFKWYLKGSTGFSSFICKNLLIKSSSIMDTPYRVIKVDNPEYYEKRIHPEKLGVNLKSGLQEVPSSFFWQVIFTIFAHSCHIVDDMMFRFGVNKSRMIHGTLGYVLIIKIK